MLWSVRPGPPENAKSQIQPEQRASANWESMNFPLRLGRFSLYRPIVNCTRPIPNRSIRMASNTPTPRFAEGEDPHQLSSDTTTLQQQGWALDAEGMGVTKTFHFKSYFKAVVSTIPCVMWASQVTSSSHF